MARPLRVEFEDAIYHLCTRGNARQRIFTTGELFGGLDRGGGAENRPGAIST